jgi:2C-methyl-D-erythritol 2,4-cyclodiphosphate synthase
MAVRGWQRTSSNVKQNPTDIGCRTNVERTSWRHSDGDIVALCYSDGHVGALCYNDGDAAALQ